MDSGEEWEIAVKQDGSRRHFVWFVFGRIGKDW